MSIFARSNNLVLNFLSLFDSTLFEIERGTRGMNAVRISIINKKINIRK